MSRNW